MYYLYKFTNQVNGRVYYGMTNDVNQRVAVHKSRAKTKVTSNPFHNAIRKYGFENFKFEIIEEFETKDSCCVAEIAAISKAKENGECIYNLHPGGLGGFSILTKSEVEIEEWREKQRIARKGKTPALGMKHSDENKKLFSEFGKKRWDIYGRYPVEEIVNMSFKDAKEKYGISKTHYYRLRKQFKTNDLE